MHHSKIQDITTLPTRYQAHIHLCSTSGLVPLVPHKSAHCLASTCLLCNIPLQSRGKDLHFTPRLTQAGQGMVSLSQRMWSCCKAKPPQIQGYKPLSEQSMTIQQAPFNKPHVISMLIYFPYAVHVQESAAAEEPPRVSTADQPTSANLQTSPDVQSSQFANSRPDSPSGQVKGHVGTQPYQHEEAAELRSAQEGSALMLSVPEDPDVGPADGQLLQPPQAMEDADSATADPGVSSLGAANLAQQPEPGDEHSGFAQTHAPGSQFLKVSCCLHAKSQEREAAQKCCILPAAALIVRHDTRMSLMNHCLAKIMKGHSSSCSGVLNW